MVYVSLKTECVRLGVRTCNVWRRSVWLLLAKTKTDEWVVDKLWDIWHAVRQLLAESEQRDVVVSISAILSLLWDRTPRAVGVSALRSPVSGRPWRRNQSRTDFPGGFHGRRPWHWAVVGRRVLVEKYVTVTFRDWKAAWRFIFYCISVVNVAKVFRNWDLCYEFMHFIYL